LTLDVDELRAGPDPVFRSTFLCLQKLAIAENARIFGHWLGEVMYEAGILGAQPWIRLCLRAVALDLRHLERFVGAERLDLGAARRQIPCFVRLIGRALKQTFGPQDRTPAFREFFLLRLPKDVQRRARSLGVYFQGALAEARAERQPAKARQGVIAELGFLVALLRDDVVGFAEEFAVTESEERLARFAGRMADRLEALARTVEGSAVGHRHDKQPTTPAEERHER